MSNKINSHYIQKALIKDIFKNEGGIYVYSSESQIINMQSFEAVGSSKGLLYGDREKALEIEKLMNDFLERDVIDKLRKISDSDETVKLSYAESFVLRKYALVTFLRLHLREANNDLKETLTKIIELKTEDEYEHRFSMQMGPMESFFLNSSIIKFHRHPDVPFITPDNFFLTMPIDAQQTNMMEIKMIVNTVPGFMIPISKNMSITFTSNWLINAFYKPIIKKSKPLRLKLNINDAGIWFKGDTDKLLADGTIDKSGFLVNNEKKDAVKYAKEIKNRDKDNTYYLYKINKMSNEDFEITLLDNLSKYIPLAERQKLKYSFYLSDKNKVIKLIDKWLNYESYVGHNVPSDVGYWSDSLERRYQHKIWELINPSVITFLLRLKRSLKE